MASGDVMQGRRVEGGALAVFNGEPGDYALTQDRRAVWMCLPNGVHVRLPVSDGPSPSEPRLWGIVEHEDGTISVTPSILLHAGSANEEWHGWLEHGVFREA